MPHILIVEDEAAIADTLIFALHGSQAYAQRVVHFVDGRIAHDHTPASPRAASLAEGG